MGKSPADLGRAASSDAVGADGAKAMRACPSCGNHVDDAARVCPNCERLLDGPAVPASRRSAVFPDLPDALPAAPSPTAAASPTPMAGQPVGTDSASAAVGDVTMVSPPPARRPRGEDTVAATLTHPSADPASGHERPPEADRHRGRTRAASDRSAAAIAARGLALAALVGGGILVGVKALSGRAPASPSRPASTGDTAAHLAYTCPDQDHISAVANASGAALNVGTPPPTGTPAVLQMIVGAQDAPRFVITICGERGRYWYFSFNESKPAVGLVNEMTALADRLETTYQFSGGLVTYRVTGRGVAVVEPSGSTADLPIQSMVCIERAALPAALASALAAAPQPRPTGGDAPPCTPDSGQRWPV